MSVKLITVGVNKDVSTRLEAINAIVLKDIDTTTLEADAMVRTNSHLYLYLNVIYI